MGYPSTTYYKSQLHVLAATEAEDEAVVLADQVSHSRAFGLSASLCIPWGNSLRFRVFAS